MKQVDREALKEWEALKESIYNDTPVDESMSAADIEKHRLWLEAPGHEEDWERFFFPKYAKYPSAPFQTKARKRVLYNPEWYEVLSWSRELAKSTKVMMAVLRLVLTGKKSTVILASATQKAAARLLAPYRANLESNRRIIQYYGEQACIGEWAELEFKTRGGAMFIGVGAGDAPRGARNEAVRPDVLLLDDFDTDEACRNPDTVNKMWKWWEEALYGTRDPAVPTLIIFCGNIIAKDCCVVRAGEQADHWDIINIRDKDGKSTWPQKNTEELIDITLKKISRAAQQKEYFNNPITGGSVFTKLAFGKVPSLRKFKFLMVYGDPAPGESKKKGASFKAVWLMGEYQGKLYVIKGFLDHETNEEFINWFFLLNDYVAGKTNVYFMVENNKLQDPFFQQVLKRHLNRIKKKRGEMLSIKPDEDKKTDKATRIEADLEPLDREGNLIFNEDEKDNPHMKELITQFDLFQLTLPYPADGPDCIQGGYRAIQKKKAKLQKTVTISRSTVRQKNKYRL